MDTPEGRIIVLRDPFGFSPAVLQVSREAFFIISLLDGTRDLRDVQAQVMRQFGQLVHTEKIEELVEQLDTCHFLDNDRYADLRQDTIVSFLESPTRPASHAGQAYSPNESELRAGIDAMFASGDEPREINWNSGGDTVRGLIVPHIDFQRGGECYALGYAELAEHSQADTHVILGTAHCGMARPFCLTLKDFETPLGTVANDREFGEELLKACPWLKEDEFSHRGEHSIEFQAVFLQYLFGGRRDFRIVPVLCGAFEKKPGEQARPAEIPQIESFIEALAQSFAKRGRSVCIIAGADLSHVGNRFGDQVPMNEQLLSYLESQDLETLDYVGKVDANGFYESVTANGGRRKICGLPNIYTMLRVIGEGSGRLVRYMQAVEKETDSVVTFASAIVERKDG